MAQPQATLLDLAAKATELSQALTKSIQDNGLQAPTLAADSPTSYEGLTPEMFLLRQQLVDVLNDMSILAQGPSESVFNYVHTVDCNLHVPQQPRLTRSRPCQTRHVSIS